MTQKWDSRTVNTQMEHSLLIKLEAQDVGISTENYAEIKNNEKDSVEGALDGSRTEFPLLQIFLNSPDPALIRSIKQAVF